MTGLAIDRKALHFLPIHEGECLRRTVLSRFKHWKECGLQTSSMKISNKFIVHMDLTKFPMDVQLYNENDPALDQLLYSGRPAPSIMGKFPVAGKVGQAVGLLARDVSLGDFV